MNRLMFLKTRFLIIGFVLALATTTFGQGTFKNGIKQGQIKVKFTPVMTTALSQVTVNARTSGFTTGIQSVDQAAKATKASNMYRLFPYDPKFEHKLRKHGLHLWYVVEIDEATDPKTAVAQFKQLKEVSVAELEHQKVLAPYNVTMYTPSAAPHSVLPFNDPLLADQWHYNNSGQLGKGDADINLFEAWKVNTGSNDVIVSVHDQGVDVNHSDLKTNIWVNTAEKNGQAGVDDDHNGYIDDVNGFNFQKNIGAIDPENHGTHVAGTIAAVNNNGIGVSGVAGGNGSGNGVKIMSLQILGGAPIEKSYVYAANNGAVISQNSWGYSSPGSFDESVRDAIEYFVAEAGDYDGSPMRGGLVLFAAGNSDYDAEWYPGYFDATMAVASIGTEWKKAYYSNYGTWVEISAPGGDQGQAYGPKGGVLSTIPKDLYAYMQGTSMACPHMSGVAALALSNRTRQMINTELWNKLVTGVVNIDEQNPDYIGKLGTGAIDAVLALKNDQGIAPETINNLVATDWAQEFAKLSWTVPADNDDLQPLSFTVYYSTQPLTQASLSGSTHITFENDSTAGKTISFEIGGLLGLTHYYVAVTSADRWGNASLISNVFEFTTNDGPSIAVSPATIGGTSQSNPTWLIDAAVLKTGTQNVTIANNAAGLLRYSSFMHARANTTSPTSVGDDVIYPTAPGNGPSAAKLRREVAENDGVVKLYSNEPVAMAYTPITKKLIMNNATNLIGETDTSLPNSAAGNFIVTETGGFNLTTVRMTLKLTRAATVAEPVVVEVYKGEPLKQNLLGAQAYTTSSLNQHTANITLNEQLYFAQGESFWVVFHIPNGNLFPLGMGFDADPKFNTLCYYSSDVGKHWQLMDDAINDKRFAWAMEAYSANADLGTFLTLSPAAGDVSGMNDTVAVVTADARNLINGNYAANLVFASNDAVNRELRIPVYLKVANHQPNVKMIDIVDYSSVFVGARKSFDIVMDNQGYGRLTNISTYTISGPGASQFIIEGSKPFQVNARDQAIVRITYVPTVGGPANATLTISGKSGNNATYTYNVSLFGVGAETSKIVVTPDTQIKTPITIGQTVSADVTVQNTGGFPLKYFIPGYDTKGVSDNWPSTYHKYGYMLRTSYATDPKPITNNFQDIKTTGVDITQHLLTTTVYYTLNIGFNFPYYGKTMDTIYIAHKGFTTFDNSIRPLNTPPLVLGTGTRPAGYISLLGTFLSYASTGRIYYKKEADRLIIQYDNVGDGVNPQTITAQMVLFSNGDIRFYYPTMGFTTSNQRYLNILIEDVDKKDGIIFHNYEKPKSLSNGFALGFDYPGPNIITGITNGSGVLAPGASATLTVSMNTSSLNEGVTNRYLNIISNDPANAQKAPLIQLDVTAGGTAQPSVSTNSIAFGDVFQGAVRSKGFTIKNNGTANVSITSMGFTNGKFSVTGDPAPLTINSGMYKEFAVVIPTGILASLEDDLVITYADASTYTIHVTGDVVAAPAISADLSEVNQNLNYKETASVPFGVDNTGAAPLEVSITGKQWATYEATGSASSVTYDVEKLNNGTAYQWMDIRKTGVHVTFPEDVFTPEGFWEQVDLPFSFEYYGVTYNKLQIGLNGVASFEDAPPVMYFSDAIPSDDFNGAHIMPYWTFGGFDTTTFATEDVGVFYQKYDDKMIITWSYLKNNFGGMGDAMSAQMFLYKNGTIKFQYRVENTNNGGDQTSAITWIGLQQNSTKGIAISPKLPLDYGTSTGLAYILTPEKTYSLPVGSSLTGSIVFNSYNVYGGTYNANLKIKSNAPNNETLLKPVQLTVNAAAVLEAPATVDFGTVMTPNPNGASKPIELRNTGSAPLDITNLKLTTSKFGVNAYAYTYNYLPSPNDPVGWGWRTTSLQFCATGVTPPHASGCNVLAFTVLPNESQKINILYFPSASGTNTDNLDVVNTAGSHIIALTGTASRAPGLSMKPVTIKDSVNSLADVKYHKISFEATNTNNGQGNLNYTVSVEYGRAANATSAETVAPTATASIQLSSVKAQPGVVPMSVGNYNRVLSYTDKTVAENWVGTGGSSPFTVATKFNAGPEGFSLSHVETYVRPETLGSGVINVEIRAGGASIAKATKVAEGSFWFTSTSEDNTGKWVVVPMTKVGRIYPNEDFYVIVTSPLGIRYPQGVINDATVTKGRYYYYSVDESTWYDINLINGFATTGWLTIAGEETAGITSWLNISSAVTGSLVPGVKDTVRLTVDSHYAMRGDQIANVLLTTNDPQKLITRIPVSLHVNEAPRFTEKDVIMMSEKEVVSVNVPVSDAEGNAIEVAAAQTYPGMSYTFVDGMLDIVLSPDYGTAGSYNYVFNATDEYHATSEFTLHVEVSHTNRAPAFIGETVLELEPNGEFVEFSIHDFYSDPDNDHMIYTVVSDDKSLADVFVSGDKFLIKASNPGEVKLTFTVTDVHGAIASNEVPVKMDVVLATEKGQQHNGLKVYPNPVEDKVAFEFSNEWRGDLFLEIVDATGRKQLVNTFDATRDGKIEVNVSALKRGVYIVRATTDDKQASIKLIKK